MKRKNTIPIRSDPSFVKVVKEIKTKRVKSGRDPPLKITSDARITLAMTRHNLFPKIKKDIIGADLK